MHILLYSISREVNITLAEKCWKLDAIKEKPAAQRAAGTTKKEAKKQHETVNSDKTHRKE